MYLLQEQDEATALTQYSVGLGQMTSGFSASWYAATAHLKIPTEGRAFVFLVNSYITIILIKNMESLCCRMITRT